MESPKASDKSQVDGDNANWINIFAWITWWCYFESSYFLAEWNDNGAYLVRCYDSYAASIKFWKLG